MIGNAMRAVALLGLAALQLTLLAACGRPDPTKQDNAAGPRGIAVQPARVTLKSPEGTVVGTALLSEDPNGVSIEIVASNLVGGAHGVHVHATGKCDTPGFESAGPHWNPTDRKHGRDNQDGAHLGDLANLQIDANGSGRSTFVIGGAQLREGPLALLDDNGAALIIHAKRDDYRTDPSGDSGDRVACAVLKG